jgi:chromate transporter
MKDEVTLPQLVVMIFLFNVETFGNGPVMIPLLQHNLVDNSHVLTTDQLLYAFTIARVTPGPANLYVTAVGFMLFGILGAILTTVAITAPGYLMIPLLRGYEHIRNARVVKGFTKGLTTVSVGLIFASVVPIAVKTLTNPVAWILFPLTFILTFWLNLNPILSLVIATVLGLILRIWI